MPTQRQWQIWDLEARAKVDNWVRQWQEDFLGNRANRAQPEPESPAPEELQNPNGRGPASPYRGT